MIDFLKRKKDPAATKRTTKDKRQKNKKKMWMIIGISAAALILVLTVAGIIIYNVLVDRYLEEINVVTKETDLVFETQIITSEDGGDVVEDPEHNGELNPDNLPLICNTKYVKNYLLLAVDSRGKEAGLSDSMILVSVNTKTGKITLCSFMRDILAKYPTTPSSPVAGKYAKLNHAHSYGGPELTMAVLKETFNIEVSQYAKINFSAFRNMVDAMGGLDMNLSSAEVNAINSILSETMQEPANNALHVTYRDMLQNKGAGTYHLTGVQALSHARNRRVGSDYARTQRQRDLIQAMAKKATTLSLSQLDNLLTTVLPLITTNIPKDMMKDMIGDIPSYLTYDIQSTRVPADGMFTEKNYNLIPDLERNCFALYELIYGEKAPGAPSGKPLPTNRYPTGGGAVKNTTTTSETTATVPETTTTVSETTTTTSSSIPVTTSTDSTTENSSVTTTTKPTTTTSAPTTTTKSETPPDTSTSAPTTTTKTSEDEPDAPEQN